MSRNKNSYRPVQGVKEGASCAVGQVRAAADRRSRGDVSENSDVVRLLYRSKQRSLFVCEKAVFAPDAYFDFVRAKIIFRKLFSNLLSPPKASRLTKRKGRLTSRRKSKCHTVESVLRSQSLQRSGWRCRLQREMKTRTNQKQSSACRWSSAARPRLEAGN